MSIKNKLQIYLITCNRAKNLEYTFEQILAKDSPIKDFDITILDNASTDNTNQVVEKYQKDFPNIKYIKNLLNVGGGVNLCKAYELAGVCGKEYAWVLCDDDAFDFSNWAEVEKAVLEDKDIICVSNYCYPNNDISNSYYCLPQMTFVPAVIFKTKYVTFDIIFTMYESLYTLFPQLCLSIYAMNNDLSMHVLSKQIVDNGLHRNISSNEASYSRGAKYNNLTDRLRKRNWILGFVDIISHLKSKADQKEYVEKAILYKDIYGSWINFYADICSRYLNKNDFHYFYIIYKSLKLKRKIQFWLWFIFKQPLRIIFNIKNLIVLRHFVFD
ncbi:glycosyltransferase family 2 protein [bacterium]|nr:glycosyltransferase family 2 protein [bacterium]